MEYAYEIAIFHAKSAPGLKIIIVPCVMLLNLDIKQLTTNVFVIQATPKSGPIVKNVIIPVLSARGPHLYRVSSVQIPSHTKEMCF